MTQHIGFVSKQNTPVDVLRSVAAVTGERNRDLLAMSLVNTLADLSHSIHISMFRILPSEKAQDAILIAQSYSTSENSAACGISCDTSDFQTVLDTNTELTRTLDDNICLSIFPIRDKANIIGLLKIISPPHHEVDRHLISAFLQVYSNYLSVLNESETDTLTGLLNRRTFENNLDSIISEPAETDDPNIPGKRRSVSFVHQPHWLAVVDIDLFKRINDKFGHLYGDEVLLILSHIMRRVFRQKDKLFRFGGEEFIIILDRTDRVNAQKVFGRFRCAIEDYHFPQVGKVTISIGFVMLENAEGPSALIGHADQALYYAKENGRNRVCYYGDLIAEGKLVAEQFSADVQLF